MATRYPRPGYRSPPLLPSAQMTASVNLQFERDERDGCEILSVRGDVDAHTAPELRAALDDVLAAGTSRLVVDLAGVDLLDSTGLGVLLGTVTRMREAGGELRVSCPDPNVRRVFEITGVIGFVQVDDSCEAAIAAMR